MEKCDCLYCHSKCPSCGSQNISVEFTVKYTFDNNFEDRIFIQRGEDSLSLQCNGCGETFESNKLSTDPRISCLSNSIMGLVSPNLVTVAEHQDDGHIEFSAMRGGK